MLDDTKPTAMISDLELALRLKEMSDKTRQATIQSLRKLRGANSAENDLHVDAVRHIVADPDPALRARLGHRASQVLSDARRALRVWDEEPIQQLALKLHGVTATCEHAIDAAHFNFPRDRAKRAEAAIRVFARHLNQPIGAIIATETVIGPKLAKLMPEDLSVRSVQSLKNKKTLIRAAICLVDPARLGRLHVDTTRIGEPWVSTLDMLLSRAPDHSPSVAAIFRRLAHTFNAEAKAPHDLSKKDIDTFVYRERQTHSKPFESKLGRAAKIWNEAIEDGVLAAIPFDRSRRDERLPDVAWETVPAAIREPVDALLAQASIADRSGGVWEDLIDDDLGVPDAESDPDDDSNLASNPDTARLWRNSVKRVWHAAAHDESATEVPETPDMLFTAQNAHLFIQVLWASRRKKLDKVAKDWEANKKGVYEAGLLKMFVQVGKLLGVDDNQLEKIRIFIRKIDPAVLGRKKMPDGTVRLIYDEVRIGRRHAEMLRAFNADSVLSRWFKAPEQLWTEALKGRSRKNGVNDKDVALARSALILRILQRVSPLRRKNLARLRISGPQPHIHLPIGNGEGRLSFPAIEMKNLRAVEVRIDPDTVRMIQEFTTTFRPISMSRDSILEENEHLFPGAEVKRPELGSDAEYPEGLGYHSLDAFGNTYSRHMRSKCALDVDMHVARHIAAKVILDIDPSAMGLVQEVLEHKRIETTRAYYAEVNKLIAQKRYLQLLDRATMRALGEINFTVFFEDALGI